MHGQPSDQSSSGEEAGGNSNRSVSSSVREQARELKPGDGVDWNRSRGNASGRRRASNNVINSARGWQVRRADDLAETYFSEATSAPSRDDAYNSGANGSDDAEVIEAGEGTLLRDDDLAMWTSFSRPAKKTASSAAAKPAKSQRSRKESALLKKERNREKRALGGSGGSTPSAAGGMVESRGDHHRGDQCDVLLLLLNARVPFLVNFS